MVGSSGCVAEFVPVAGAVKLTRPVTTSASESTAASSPARALVKVESAGLTNSMV